MEGKKTFLIVDDDSDDYDFFCEAVSEIDSEARCFTAINGEDALKKLRIMAPQLPDFIFLDLNMPRMDGRECLLELKKDIKLRNIPVIIFTTSSAQKDIDDTMATGATYFLTKPSDFQSLRNTIQFVMNKVSASLHE